VWVRYQVKAGEKDIVVLEKEPALANVTTAQAAGLVGQVRDNLERVKLAMWSVQTFTDLQQDPDHNPNWRYHCLFFHYSLFIIITIIIHYRQVGSLRVAYTKERQDEFKKMVAVCEQVHIPSVL
jgi:glycine/D-amino acid oxidase-like deaminating enzyme